LRRQNSYRTGVEITRATKHESPFYKSLLDQTAKAGFTMREVSADKGYSSTKNLQATADHGAVPFIPFGSNVQPDIEGLAPGGATCL